MLAMFSTFPVDKGETLSDEVAKVIQLIDTSGMTYQTTAMGTIIEGEWDAIMELVKKCHNEIRKNSKRVYTRLTIDDREGVSDRLVGKVFAIERKLGREIRK